MSSGSRTKRACDRCHSVKERCRWRSESSICERCHRLNQPCNSLRPLQKAGRKARSVKILLSSSPNENVQDVELFGWPTQGSSPSSNQSIRSRSPELYWYNTVGPHLSLPIFTNIDSHEDNLLQLCLSNQASVGRFTLGPSFHESHKRAFVRQLHATPLLKDAFLSCATILASDQNIFLPEPVQEMCQRKAAVAISSLRSLRLSSRKDISACLVFGVAITTFALYVAGGEVLPICRYALNLVKPAYDSFVDLDKDDVSFLTCLVFTETAECLLKAEVPTLKMRIEDVENNVDRFLGISAPLLLHQYDLCYLNHVLRQGTDSSTPTIINNLHRLEETVSSWAPLALAEHSEKFTQPECTNMVAQACILRLTTLIVIHRMQYPYGRNDRKSYCFAQALLKEIEIAMQLTCKPIKCMDLCFLTAAFELTKASEQQLAIERLSNLLAYSPLFLEKLKYSLASLWAAKECSKNIFWYNLSQYIVAEDPS